MYHLTSCKFCPSLQIVTEGKSNSVNGFEIVFKVVIVFKVALPVGEDVLDKDCRRHQNQDHQEPYHPCEVGILQQVLDSWGIFSKTSEFYNTYHEWRNFLHRS